MFNFKKSKEKQNDEGRYSRLSSLNLKQIWKLDDEDELLDALRYHLDRKSEFCYEFDRLSRPEMIFYATRTLINEVNDGGFSSYFYSEFANVYQGVPNAFREMGAENAGAICEAVINIFNRRLPVDGFDRIDFLEEFVTAEVDARLEQFTEKFLNCADDLTALGVAYVKANRKAFK